GSRRLDIRRVREELISTTLQQQLIEQQSFTDPLTEIYNRRSLDEIAGRFISHARRLGNPLTFLMVDVNNFKQVNTKFGHLTGDTVLAEFAGLLKTSIRGSDAEIGRASCRQRVVMCVGVIHWSDTKYLEV